MPNPTPWTIVGPGAIGLWFYSQLTQCAHSDSAPFLLHRNFEQPYSTLTVTELSGEQDQYPIRWAEPESPITKLIITTKSHQVIDCIEQLQPHLSEHCQIILLHNGLGPQHIAETRWPNYNIYFASTTVGVWKQSHNRIIHAGAGITQLGQSNARTKNSSHTQHPFTELEQIGIEWQPNIEEQLHLKVAINAAINPLTVLFECQNGHLIHDSNARTLLEALCQETEGIFDAANIPHPDLTRTALDVAERTGANYSSSYQDWKHQRKTELSQMNGYIQQLAKKHGRQTPTHDKVMVDVLKKAII